MLPLPHSEDELRQKVIITYFYSIVTMSCDSGPDPSNRVSHNNHGHSVKSWLSRWAPVLRPVASLCVPRRYCYIPNLPCTVLVVDANFNEVKTTGCVAFPAFEKTLRSS